MARPAAVVTGLFAASLLVACSGNKEAAKQPDPAPAQAPAPTPKPAPDSTPSPHAHAASDDGSQPRVSRTGLKVRFGIMPGNYDDDQDGIVVDDVYPNTSAADAGIKKGDRLMTWNGSTIHDVQNWMEFMSRHNPGDVVDIGVLRGGTIVPVKVTLKGPE
jgi:S1-C subfamily serine protease